MLSDFIDPNHNVHHNSIANDSECIIDNSINNEHYCDIDDLGTCISDVDSYVDELTKLKSVSQSNDGLFICHLNVRSLLPKVEQIRYVVDYADIDILCLNETWLDADIGLHEFSIDGYVAVNKPRNRHGGGVLVYVKNNVSFKRRLDLEVDDLECIWLQLTFGKQVILLCSMYRPPSMGSDYYDTMLDSIELATLEDKMVILTGDLNFNYSNEKKMDVNPLYFIESANNLTQLVSDYTRVTPTSKSIIDVILSSHPESHLCTGIGKIAMSDHYLVYTVVKSIKPSINEQVHHARRYRCYKNFDQNLFVCEILNSEILKDVCNTDDLHSAWDAWKKEFLRICERHAPIRTARMKRRYNPWINKDILKLMYRRDYAHKRSINNPSSDIVNEYKALRNDVNIMIENSKKQYYEQLCKDGKTNSNNLWKELKKLSGSVPKNDPNTKLSSDVFNEFYSTLGHNVTKDLANNSSDLLWKGPESVYKFKFCKVTENIICKLLRSMSNTSSLDILDFDCKLLKTANKVLAKSLTHIVNLSLSTGVVPNDWKIGRITPVYKGCGSYDDPVNYRPISVLGHIAKIVEKEVQLQLMSFLLNFQFITLDQFAYRKFHSTTNCLHATIDDWLQSIDDKQCTGVAFLDISKCFDTINHELLLKKLNKYGITDLEWSWFNSYLSNRSQCVSYNNKLSQLTDITIGVPQGSTLGPLLFVLFVNDLPMHINNGRCTMYADDTIIHTSHENAFCVEDKLNDVLFHVCEWYKSNKLVLNVKKSNTMLIANTSQVDNLNINLNGTRLDHVKCTKYLGVMLDDQLKFDVHVSELVKRISAKLSWLSRLRHIVPKPVLVLAYKSYIQPIFDYACTIWGCSNVNISTIQRLQNRAARIICSNFDIINVRGEDLVRQLNWQNVSQRIDYFLATQMYNCIHGNAPDYLCNSIVMECDTSDVNTRSSNTMNVQVPFCRTNNFKKSFIYRGSVVWNQLSSDVQESSTVMTFKANVKRVIA